MQKTTKLIFSLCLLVSQASVSYAQCTFENLSRNYETKHNKLETYFNKGVLRISTTGSCAGTQVELIDFCNGEKIWATPLWSDQSANFIAKNNFDSSIVIGTSALQGDVIMPPKAGFVFLNDSGSVYKSYAFQMDTVFPQIGNNIWFSNVEVSSNGVIFASMENNILKVDTAGNILSKVSTSGIVNTFVLDELQQKITLLTTNEISFYNLNLNSISVKYAGENYTGVSYSDSNYYIATATNKIYQADRQWNIIDSVQLNEAVIKIKFSDSLLFVLTKDASENYFIKKYSSFQSNQNSYAIQNNFTPLDFTLHDNFIKIGGHYNVHGSNFSYYQSLPISSTQYLLSNYDIGVVNVAFENYLQTPNPNAPIPGQNSLKVEFDIIATVKNFSNITITKFAVYSNVLGGMNCAHWIYYNLTDTILNPNDSVRIKVGKFDYPYNSPNATISICINSVAPNEQPDSDVSNDRFCQQRFINKIGEIGEIGAFSIYPIPTSKSLFVTMNKSEFSANTRFIITDTRGCVILEKSISFQETSIDVSQYASGYYYYRITENGIDQQNGKIIIE
jgi:hypothetical protein